MLDVIRAEIGLFIGIAAYEILLGFVYNAFTAQLEHKGYLDGFVSLQVAGGVFLTLIPWIAFDLPSITVVGGFVCSGLPMIIGSISRYAQRRQEGRQMLARLTSYGDKPPRVAK